MAMRYLIAIIKTFKAMQMVENEYVPVVSESSQNQTKRPASTSAQKPKVPRPSNAWILYRSDCLAKIKQEQAEVDPANRPKGSQTELSKELATRWLNESKEVRERYLAKAEQVKLNHKLLYPEYQYKPRRKTGGGVRMKSAARGMRTVRNTRQVELETRKMLPAQDELEDDNEEDGSYVEGRDQRRGRSTKSTKNRNTLKRREENKKAKKTSDVSGIAVDLSFEDAEEEDNNELAMTPVFPVQVNVLSSSPSFALDDTPDISSLSASALSSLAGSRAQTPSFTFSEPSTSSAHSEDLDMSANPPYLRVEMDNYLNLDSTDASIAASKPYVDNQTDTYYDSQSLASFANFAYDPAVMLAPETAANLANEWANIDTACLGLDFALGGCEGGDSRMDLDLDIAIGNEIGSENYNYINDVFGDIPTHYAELTPIDIPNSHSQPQSMFKYVDEMPTIYQEPSSYEEIARAGLASSCSSNSTFSSTSSSVQSYTQAIPDALNTDLTSTLNDTHIGKKAKSVIGDYFHYEDEPQTTQQTQQQDVTPSHQEIFRAFQRQLAETHRSVSGG